MYHCQQTQNWYGAFSDVWNTITGTVPSSNEDAMIVHQRIVLDYPAEIRA